MKGFIVLIAITLTSCAYKEEDKQAPFSSKKILFQVPKNFPSPVYDFSRNPITQEGFELGRALFYDGILSRDGTVSCSFCHIQTSAFTQHGHAVSHGIDDLPTRRNSQPIMNLAWVRFFFWDGGVFDLDLFPPHPIQAPNEMGETMSNVLEKLRKHPHYPKMFKAAFGTEEITTDRFLKALSQFQLMCISANSRYDKFVRNEGGILTSDELKGLSLFREKCSVCHAGELFTDGTFRNNGLPVYSNDLGRAEITLNPDDRYKFKVPSLRNVVYTAPYMHDGRFKTLDAVLEHYRKGVVDSATTDPILKQNGILGIPMSDEEKRQIIAFLQTLTDTSFITRFELSEFAIKTPTNNVKIR
ncbi:MAG: cytochrome-c peroxidase [Cytophagales bacterium]|nr:cytochrome-c peroxidase [Cytophagales bacterium]MDW8383941.1 cytochrome c peroxidase [Flammeovirgaceae bacterium]